MDHSLEAHVDLAATDDFSDIGGVVRLKKSNLQALILEITLGLSEVQGGMVRRSVPLQVSNILRRLKALQLLPVGEESDLVGRHIGQVSRSNCKSATSQHYKHRISLPCYRKRDQGIKPRMSFRWYYPDQVMTV